jgi:transitional endoplasmic reticulum ATPase
MARQAAPCILIIDEIESIAPRRIAGTEDPGRNRMVTQLLTELSGLEGRKNVYVIGTTNRPDLIDEAFLRPGRFGKLIEVPPPDLEGREEIFKIHTQIMQVAEDVDYRELAELTDGYSGADIEEICKMAKALARQDLIYSLEGDPARIGEAVKGWKVGMAYFRAAIEKIPPSLGRKEEGGEISHLM